MESDTPKPEDMSPRAYAAYNLGIAHGRKETAILRDFADRMVRVIAYQGIEWELVHEYLDAFPPGKLKSTLNLGETDL